eukprot:GILJ01004761.1.p1 GENE.GILJ01004761.1~~GILJ01004761.1.p1  ORF type:complete len:1147 (+),score=188.32 GILJ01004761.1:454-3441(+)
MMGNGGNGLLGNGGNGNGSTSNRRMMITSISASPSAAYVPGTISTLRPFLEKQEEDLPYLCNSEDEFVQRMESLSYPRQRVVLRALYQQAQQLKRFTGLVGGISNFSERDAVIKSALQSLQTLLGVERVAFYALDSEKQYLIEKMSFQGELNITDRNDEVRFPLSEDLVFSRAIEGNEVVNNSKVMSEFRGKAIIDICDLTDNMCIVAPLHEGDVGITGAIYAGTEDTDRVFSAAEEQLVKALMAVTAGQLKKIQGPGVNETFRKQQYMRRLSSSVSREIQTHKVIEKIVESLPALLEADTVTVYIISRDRRHLTALQQNDKKKTETISALIPIGRGIAGRVAVAGDVVKIQDVSMDHRFDPNVDQPFGVKTKNLICMPIVDPSGIILAVVEVINKQNGFFTDEDETFLQGICIEAGAVIRNSQLYEDAVKAHRQTAALCRIVKAVSNQENLDEVIAAMVQVTYECLNVDRVSLFLVDDVKRELFMKVSKDSAGVRLPFGQGIAGTVAVIGEILNIPDAYADHRFNRAVDIKTGFVTRNILCIPIKDHNNKVVAVLQAINKPHGPFTTEDEELISAFTAEVGSAISKQSLQQALIQAVTQDESSGGAGGGVKSMLNQFIGSESGMDTLDLAISPKRSTLFARSSSVKNELLLAKSLKLDSSDIQMLKGWDFDIFAYSSQELCAFSFDMFRHFDLIDMYKIEPAIMGSFLSTVCENYRDNPYHNFKHGFSVLQAIFILLATTEIGSFFQSLELLGLLVASLCHDLDHPGFNNDYFVKSYKPLAIMYNDMSVLENHHAAMCFQIIKNDDTNIFCNLTDPQFKEVRRTMIPAILATDMKHHFDMTSTLKQFKRSEATKEKKEDRQFLANTIVHAADIGNPVLPIDACRKWAFLVVQEFWSQAKKEEDEGLPVAPTMQCNPEDEAAVAQLQMNFIDYVVSPLWTALAGIFPDVQSCCDQMKANREYWSECKTKVLALRQAEAEAAATGTGTVKTADSKT